MSSNEGPRVKLLLRYDGTDFSGWQKQKQSSLPTVQGTMEKLLSKIFNEPVRVIGASRTDAGVHALGQIAHFIAPKPLGNYKILRSLNAMAPPALVVRAGWQAPEDFHALASSTGKTYRYRIHNSGLRDPLRRHRMAWVAQPLDIAFLNQAASHLIGTHDFKSFQTAGSDVSTTERTILGAVWRRLSPTVVEFSITGSGFLKQMVRNLVGTMIDLQMGREPHEMMKEILNALDRRKALSTAAPEGLYLVKVHYPESLDIRCRKL